MSAANARNVTRVSRDNWLVRATAGKRRWLWRLPAAIFLAWALVLATSQIARADETNKGFCVRSGNGDCADASNLGDSPTVDPYDSNTSTLLRANAGNVSCNNGKVATGGANGCWWPFTTHSFDTYYHNDAVVTLVFTGPDSCIAARTSDNTVVNTNCGGGGVQWVRDGTYGFVSVADSDHQGSHEYLRRVTVSGTGFAALGPWVAIESQWAFCHDTASGCQTGQ